MKQTQLIGRRPLSPCCVRKTTGYTVPHLLFSRTVPRFSEMYPDLAGSETLSSSIFSARITYRCQQRTPKPKSSCLATSIASLGGRSAPTKEHQNINNSSISKHTMAYHHNSFQSNFVFGRQQHCYSYFLLTVVLRKCERVIVAR